MPTKRTYISNHCPNTIFAKVATKEMETVRFDAGVTVGVDGVGANVGMTREKALLEAGFVRIPTREHADFQFSTLSPFAFDVYISVYMEDEDGFSTLAENFRKRVGNDVVITQACATRNMKSFRHNKSAIYLTGAKITRRGAIKM